MMKIKYLIFALFAAIACNNPIADEVSSVEVSLSATIKDETSKAHITDGRFTWSSSDRISVWTTKDQFQTLTIAEGVNTSVATFKGYLIGDDVALTTCAIYPAGPHALTGDNIIVNLPDNYDLTDDIHSVKVPMFAHLDNNDMALFTPMCGLMAFTFTNVPGSVTKIIFESLDKTVTGQFEASIQERIPILYASEHSEANTVTLNVASSSEFRDMKLYVPLPVGEYNGLRIVMIDENDEIVFSKETLKSNTVSRKTVVNMPAIDVTPKPLTNKDKYAMMVKEVSSNMKKYAYDTEGNKLLTIAHSSDIHPRGTNYQRNTEEYISYCNSNKDIIDAALLTGDFSNGIQGRLIWWTTQEFECVLPIMDKSQVPLYTLTGNHDDNINLTTGRPAVQSGINPKNAELYHIPKTEQYQWLIGPYLEKYSPEEADPQVCYYKVDYDDYKIRMIFLDASDCPLIFEGGYLKYVPGLFFNQRQLEWFYDTLCATPDDYGVIVVCHGPFIEGFERATYAQGASMIPNIIEAFKTGSVYEHSWTYSNDSTISTSFEFDFRGRGKGDFICYLAGHIHYRRIGKSYFKDQLVITAPALYQADMSEMTRKGSSLDRFRDTTTINSFNLMSVDKTQRKIYLTSFGAYEDETAQILKRTEELNY